MGTFELRFFYIDLTECEEKEGIFKDLSLNIFLDRAETRLGAIVTEAKRAAKNIRTTSMSIVKPDVNTICKVSSMPG